MASEEISDDKVGQAVFFCVIKDQVKKVTKNGNTSVPPLSKIELNLQEEQLLKDVGGLVRVIGDRLAQEISLNHFIDQLARVANASTFQKLVKEVFSDDEINWGRIIVLFYSVGRLAAKMVCANLTPVFKEIVSLSLDFFKGRLLKWICSKGGWICSIPELAQFSIERFSSSFNSIILSAGFVLMFISGTLIGGFIVWKWVKAK